MMKGRLVFVCEESSEEYDALSGYSQAEDGGGVGTRVGDNDDGVIKCF